MNDLTRRSIPSAGALSLLTLDASLAQAPLSPTPECRDGDAPTIRQLEGPFFTPMSPERADLILIKMTAKQPRYRYQTCAELIKDLESLGLANETLTFLHAPPAPATEQPGPSAAIPPLPRRAVPAKAALARRGRVLVRTVSPRRGSF